MDTIVAQATPPGRGSVGIVRVSGPSTLDVALAIIGKKPRPRYADYLPFTRTDGELLDQGIALYFPGPHSFTGEDVLELQGHGGPIVIDMLIQQILQVPRVRLARPGEFSERAFLNNKLDLAQAESIADLIDASSERAAKSALQSLQGRFSNRINSLIESLTSLRASIEASIDFPEETDLVVTNDKLSKDLKLVISQLEAVYGEASQGTVLREGIKVVIVGRPNAGKSSLLNALSGRESAIVTDIAGTTRDVIREHIQVDGISFHISDTAGLRTSSDEVERVGIKRAWNEIEQADHVLFIVDGMETNAIEPVEIWPDLIRDLPKKVNMTVIRNKVDQTNEVIGVDHSKDITLVRLSARTGQGIDALKAHLKECSGYLQFGQEGCFMARRRHLNALEEAEKHLKAGEMNLRAGTTREILAGEMYAAQQHLGGITGRVSSNELLGHIFSSFCIGK